MPQPPTGIDERGIPRGPRRLKNGVGGGMAVLGSGQAVVTVSHGMITASDHITLTAYPTSFGAVGSNQGYICVRSINPAVGFQAGPITGVAFPWDTNIFWLIHKLS